MVYPNGSDTVLSSGPWAQMVSVLNCPCADGKRRRAHITGQPDSFFSIPARVAVKGRWVTGFVTTAPDYKPGVKEGLIFHPNKSGRNAGLLPEWSDETFAQF